MKIISLLPVFTIVLSFVCCKQEATTTETQEGTATPESQEVNPNLATNMSWTFLTHQLFHHNVTVVSGEVDQETQKGHWMDFHDDGTYDYGVWGNKSYSGTWQYDENAKLLELKPSDGTRASEWQVSHRDDQLILVGTVRYGDNRYQVRWLRREDRPAQNAQ